MAKSTIFMAIFNSKQRVLFIGKYHCNNCIIIVIAGDQRVLFTVIIFTSIRSPSYEMLWKPREIPRFQATPPPRPVQGPSHWSRYIDFGCRSPKPPQALENPHSAEILQMCSLPSFCTSLYCIWLICVEIRKRETGGWTEPISGVYRMTQKPDLSSTEFWMRIGIILTSHQLGFLSNCNYDLWLSNWRNCNPQSLL